MDTSDFAILQDCGGSVYWKTESVLLHLYRVLINRINSYLINEECRLSAYWTGRFLFNEIFRICENTFIYPGYLKIKHPLRLEKNFHCQTRTSNSYDRVKLFAERGIERRDSGTIGAHCRRYRIAASPFLPSLFPDGWQPGSRSCDNRIVYDETLDACLPPLVSSASETMVEKSPILRPSASSGWIYKRSLKRWAAS